MKALQVTLAAAAARITESTSGCQGVFIQAPSTNSQSAYIGDCGAQIITMAPNTTVTLSNILIPRDIFVRGTAGDKINVILM